MNRLQRVDECIVCVYRRLDRNVIRILETHGLQQFASDIFHAAGLAEVDFTAELVLIDDQIETVQINGPVQIGEVRVAAGDLVVADDTGVCFIPRDVVLEVLDAAEQKAKAEAVRCKAIDDGVPVPDIARATYGEK